VDFRETGSGIAVKLQTGEWKTFDVLYAALGSRVHSDLAKALREATAEDGVRERRPVHE